ncbi:MAG: hypothetical protein KI792_02635 [Alphaproteobacteria bacterium]|nr:hypothetical protein [Alphaproteobacteria bacterium SS10]
MSDRPKRAIRLAKAVKSPKVVAMGALAILTLGGCATVTPQTGAQSTVLRTGPLADARAGGNYTLPAYNAPETTAGRPIFGTYRIPNRVDPYGRRDYGANKDRITRWLGGQGVFGGIAEQHPETIREVTRGALDRARLTERREPWMDQVTRDNNVFAQGGTVGSFSALMVMEDPQDFATIYKNLFDRATGPNANEERTRLLQAYRDTMAARENTALLLQADPRVENFVDYARLELGRRLLGDVLERSGVLVRREVRQDAVPTYGFLQSTAIGLAGAQSPYIGPTQSLLADDRAQRFGGHYSPKAGTEARYVRGIYRQIQREAQLFNQNRNRAAQERRDANGPLIIGSAFDQIHDPSKEGANWGSKPSQPRRRA